MGAAVGFRRQHADVLADQFFFGITENCLGGGIERMNDAALVNGDDAVDGAIDDSAGAGLAFPERFLGPFTIGDVEGGADDPYDFARQVLQGNFCRQQVSFTPFGVYQFI